MIIGFFELVSIQTMAAIPCLSSEQVSTVKFEDGRKAEKLEAYLKRVLCVRASEDSEQAWRGKKIH